MGITFIFMNYTAIFFIILDIQKEKLSNKKKKIQCHFN